MSENTENKGLRSTEIVIRVRHYLMISSQFSQKSTGATTLLPRNKGITHSEERPLFGCGPIENYHRGLKQCCGVERCQARAGRAQRNHIGMAIRAFLRLERHFYATGVSWYEAKARIVRGAIRAYIAKPLYGLS